MAMAMAKAIAIAMAMYHHCTYYFFCEAINSKATAASILAVTAVTAPYATAAVDPLLGKCESLYFDSSRDKLGNIASVLGKSLGLHPRDFPRSQAIFPIISFITMEY